MPLLRLHEFWTTFWFVRIARQCLRDLVAKRGLQLGTRYPPSRFILETEADEEDLLLPDASTKTLLADAKKVISFIDHLAATIQVPVLEYASYCGEQGQDQDLHARARFLRDFVQERCSLEPHDATTRAIRILMKSVGHKNKLSIALIVEMFFSEYALKLVEAHLKELCDQVNVTRRVVLLMDKVEADGEHLYKLLSDAYNPWDLTRSMLISLSSQEQRAKLEHMAHEAQTMGRVMRRVIGDSSKALRSASPSQFAEVLKNTKGYGVFRLKNLLRIRMVGDACLDLKRSLHPAQSYQNFVLCGSGPRRMISHYQGTTVWEEGKRKIACFHSVTAAALLLWSKQLLAVQTERLQTFKGMRSKFASVVDSGNCVGRMVMAELTASFRDVYMFQFIICEESQLMAHVDDEVDDA